MAKPINYRRDRGELVDIPHGIESATLPAMVDADARDAAAMAYATTLQGYGFSPLDRLYASALAAHERAIGAPLSDRETVRALAFELDRVAE